MRSTTSAGSGGGCSPDALSQPLAGEVSQSRTICLSYDGCGRPGCHSSAGQNRDESGVSTSSPSTTVPSGRRPNSSFVSARMMPRSTGDLLGPGVDLQGEVTQPGGRVVADGAGDGGVRDVLVVVADGGLRGGGEDRLGEAAAVLEPGGQRDAADLAGGAVVGQPGAGEVAAHDALDGVHLEALADHRAPLHRVRHVGRDHVVGDDVGELVEPPQRHLGEHDALVGDGAVQHVVVGRDPVAGHHQQVAVGEPVEVADLAGVEVLGAVDVRGGRDPRERARHGGDPTQPRPPVVRPSPPDREAWAARP